MGGGVGGAKEERGLMEEVCRGRERGQRAKEERGLMEEV